MEHLIQNLQKRRLGVLYILKMIPVRIWNWRPEPKLRTTAELATHLAASPMMLWEAFQGKIPDEETYVKTEKARQPNSAQGLVALYEDGLAKLVSYLKAHLNDSHEKTIQFFYHDQKSSIYEEVFNEIGHQWFHLGQLFVYLRQNTVNVDMGAYYGYKDPDPTVSPQK